MALLGLFISYYGNRDASGHNSSCHLCHFPDPSKYHYRFTRVLILSLEEAGIAFGMTKWERLKKFEIPLAMPVIMSGIRTAAVMIIGTATLAALIGAGDLVPLSS